MLMMPARIGPLSSRAEASSPRHSVRPTVGCVPCGSSRITCTRRVSYANKWPRGVPLAASQPLANGSAGDSGRAVTDDAELARLASRLAPMLTPILASQLRSDVAGRMVQHGGNHATSFEIDEVQAARAQALQELEATRDAVLSVVSEYSTRLGAAEAAVAGKDADLAGLRKELEAASSRERDAETRATEAVARLKEEKARVAKAMAAIAAEKARADKAEAQARAAEQEKEEWEEAARENKHRMHEAEFDAEEHRRRVENMGEELEEAEERVKVAEARAGREASRAAAAERRAAEAEAAAKAASVDVPALQAELASLRAALQERDASMAELRRDAFKARFHTQKGIL